jgi:hypothetical protein
MYAQSLLALAVTKSSGSCLSASKIGTWSLSTAQGNLREKLGEDMAEDRPRCGLGLAWIDRVRRLPVSPIPNSETLALTFTFSLADGQMQSFLVDRQDAATANNW